MKISDLAPHPKNPRTITPAKLDQLKKALLEFGDLSGIVFNRKTKRLVGGHQRVKSLDPTTDVVYTKKYSKPTKTGTVAEGHVVTYTGERYSYREVSWDETREKAANLAANKGAGEWDLPQLREWLKELGSFDLNFDLDLTMFDGDELKEFGDIEVSAYTRNGPTGVDEDDVPEKAPARTKLGDVYRLGRHRLMCGDSTSEKDVRRLMKGELADLVFTDPPYGVDYDGGHAEPGKRREKLANDGCTTIYTDAVPAMFAFSKPNAALYLWFAATKALDVLQVLQANKYDVRCWLIWNKNMAQFGAIGAQYKQKHEPCLYAYKRAHAPFWGGPNNEVSVWDVARSSKNEFHPTQKPVELSKRAIENSCPPGGLVLDLFGGSGATLIGAEATERTAHLMELDPSYCDVIVERWEKYTGKSAKLINTVALKKGRPTAEQSKNSHA